MRRIALIPARGNSKGLPGKNLALISGETLVARAVRCGREAGIFDTIVATTDSEEIAAEARAAGAEVPFLRPPGLAEDQSAVIDAVRHALDTLAAAGIGRFDTVALLEPTSPLRTPAIVRRTVEAAESEDADAALTVSPAPRRFHPLKQLAVGPDRVARAAVAAGAHIVNRQELETTYVRNGMCYAARTAVLATSFNMLGSRAKAVITEGPVVNIDDADDLAMARAILEKNEDGIAPAVEPGS